MGAQRPQPLRVGIYDLGLIGQRLVTLFRDRKPEGLQLVAATSRNLEAAPLAGGG